MTQSFADFLMEEKIDLGPVPATLETACKAVRASYPTTLRDLEKAGLNRPQISAATAFATEYATITLTNTKNSLESDSNTVQLAALKKHRAVITKAFFQGEPARFDFVVLRIAPKEELTDTPQQAIEEKFPGISQQTEEFGSAVYLTMYALAESKAALAKAFPQDVKASEVLDKALDAYIARGFSAAVSQKTALSTDKPQGYSR